MFTDKTHVSPEEQSGRLLEDIKKYDDVFDGKFSTGVTEALEKVSLIDKDPNQGLQQEVAFLKRARTALAAKAHSDYVAQVTDLLGLYQELSGIELLEDMRQKHKEVLAAVRAERFVQAVNSCRYIYALLTKNQQFLAEKLAYQRQREARAIKSRRHSQNRKARGERDRALANKA